MNNTYYCYHGTIGVILLTLLLSHAHAQEREVGMQMDHYPAIESAAKDARRTTEETVNYPSFGDECAFELVTLGIENQWGRVSGMNGFGDREKAQTLAFTSSDSYRVVGAMLWFERPAIDGDGTVVVKVYEPREIDGRPDRLLGQSDAAKVSDIVTSDSTAAPTLFTFDQTAPVLVNGSRFILSCDFSNLYQTFDTLVLLQTIPECGNGADTWELLSDGEIWLNIVSDFSWQLNADWAISAVVDFDDPTSTNAFIKQGDLTLYPPVPNPAHEKVQIIFELLKAEKVGVEVYTASGKKIHAMILDYKSAGNHQVPIDVSGLPAGLYYYRVRAGKSSITSRISIQ